MAAVASVWGFAAALIRQNKFYLHPGPKNYGLHYYLWGQNKSFNSKESSEAFPGISEQVGPSIHKMKGFCLRKLKGNN